YWDAQFDDARLAVALARTAVKHGATVLNHTKVVELIKEGGKVRGVVAEDRFTGSSLRAKGAVVVNATGVFSDGMRHLDDPASGTIIEPSQGIHLVLDADFLGGETAVMIPKTDDGRVLFAIPWQGRLVVGTTDTSGVPVALHPKPLEEEIEYLLEHAGRYLDRAPKREDVRATFAGLRPLVKPKGSAGSTAAISRDHSLFVSDSGLVTVAGGKWTTYRKMAEDTVDRAAAVGGLPTRPCLTADLTLLDRPAAEDLKMEDPSWSDKLAPEFPWRVIDVVAAVRLEMARTVDDVLSRRTRMTFLDEMAAAKCAPKVEAILRQELEPAR
ncbi:MAG: FAD-dependent oxidoreductase, partial [Verrucomicrobiae bacterium]|nr:FAD-dependent oxidoreductase [Verrucomicrobiae bacterium]